MVTYCLELYKRAVTKEGDLEEVFSRLPPVIPFLLNDIPKPDRVQMPLVSFTPFPLVHPLLASPFLSPANVWNMIATMVQALGIAQRVVPLMEWLRTCTVTSLRTTDALVRVDLVDA